MSHGLLEIDHLLTAADPEAGRIKYERLGFTLTPISVIDSLGVGNRLILFHTFTPGAANFIELMGVMDAARVAGTSMGKLLSGPPGVRSMVLSGPDAQRTYESLAGAGFPFEAPLDIQREWRLPDGEILHPSFRVMLPIAAPLQFNFCQYRTLHYYLRPAWLEHENGALHLTRVFAHSTQPATIASYYERAFATRARLTNALHELGPGQCLLSVGDRTALSAVLPDRWLSPNDQPASYVGFEVQVRSLAVLQALLTERRVDFVEHGQGLVVAPQEACGNVLRFVERAKADVGAGH